MAQGNIPPAFGFSREFKPAKDARHSINAGERRIYRSRDQHGVRSVKAPSSLLISMLQPSIQSSGSELYVARVCPAPDSKESPVKLNSEEIARLFVKITPNFVSPLRGIDHGRIVKLTEVWMCD